MSSSPNNLTYEIVSEIDNKRRDADKIIIDFTIQNLDSLLKSLYDLSQGVAVLQRAPDGSMVKVYKRPPDLKALTYLIDRVVGKPVQALDLTTGGDKLSFNNNYDELSDEQLLALLSTARGAIDTPRALPPQSS